MTWSYFGFMTLLGIIALAGIVINNGIVRFQILELPSLIDPPEPLFGLNTRHRRMARVSLPLDDECSE